MKTVDGRPLSHVGRRGADLRMLEYSMDFVFAVQDALDEAGMTRKELADRLGCKEGRVDRVLGGDAEITLETVAAYDAALGLGFKLRRGDGAR